MCAGVEQLPAATPYALEALAAPSHALRRLGCQQLGAALPVSLLDRKVLLAPELKLRRMLWVQAVSAEQQQRIAGALVDALADKDTGVSCDAAAALQSYGSNDQGVLNLQWQLSCLQSCDQYCHASSALASLLCHHDCISK